MKKIKRDIKKPNNRLVRRILVIGGSRKGTEVEREKSRSRAPPIPRGPREGLRGR